MGWAFAIFNLIMLLVLIVLTLGAAGIIPGLRAGFPLGADFGPLMGMMAWALGVFVFAIIFLIRWIRRRA